MMPKEVNDLYFVCTIIECIARLTKNRVSDVVKLTGKDGLQWQLDFADVNHCLTFEQVSDEWITKHGIAEGNFDAVGSCKYKVPSETAIGSVYRNLIMDVRKPEEKMVDVLYAVYCSFISDEISNFNTNVFYSNPDYLKQSYLHGQLLDD